MAKSNGFSPQTLSSRLGDDADSDANGDLNPEQSEQWELGFKNKQLDDAILTTVTLYEIVKDDVTVGNPLNTGPDNGQPNTIQIGKVTSKGIEFDIVGDITDVWKGTFSYAYNDAKISDGAPNSISNTKRYYQQNHIVLTEQVDICSVPFESVFAYDKYSRFSLLQLADFKILFCNTKNDNNKMATITNKADLGNQDMLYLRHLINKFQRIVMV